MLPGLHRILLRRKSESIVSHSMQHIFTFHAVVPCHNVCCNISERMAYMQAFARRVGEHGYDEIRRTPVRVIPPVIFKTALHIPGPERAFPVPYILPVFLYGLRSLRSIPVPGFRIGAHNSPVSVANSCMRLSPLFTTFVYDFIE